MTFPDLPFNYLLCINEQCPRSATCLRQMVVREVSEDMEWWPVISPKRLAALKGDCPYYRSNVKVQFAKGFIQLIESLPYKQMRAVIHELMEHFSRRTYFRIRKGERLLSPSEQRAVLHILKRNGVTAPLQFDAYVEGYDW
ncbi:DUF6078 family protein [Bacteroides sp.]